MKGREEVTMDGKTADLAGVSGPLCRAVTPV